MDRDGDLPLGTAPMKSPDRQASSHGLEYLAMVLAIAGLGAASGMNWRTLDGPIHESEWESSGALPRFAIHRLPARKDLATSEGTAMTAPLPEGPIQGCLEDEEPEAEPVFEEVAVPVQAAKTRNGPIGPPRPVMAGPRRVRVGDEFGRAIVARIYGGPDSRVVTLPDGRLGWPNGMVYTEEKFTPITADELTRQLQDREYKHFQVHRTEHYIIFHTCSAPFAEQSGRLLESLYRGLFKAFKECGLDVHEAEFPLVAVIFRNESEFREYKAVSPDIQAYYEVLSNRIFFYETRDREPESPEVAAMRKPQTVAHEGTHQILQNIGVQPRLARWPIWLVEGLAEFCAPPGTIGGEWAGFGKANPIHLATIKDLEDPMSLQGRNTALTHRRIARSLGHSTMQYLFHCDELSPTDYSMSWAMTHFLATKRSEGFAAYLRAMSQMPPLVLQTAEDQARAFRDAFGDDLQEIGKELHRHMNGMKRLDTLPYYALTFEQPLGDGLVRRGTIVSQSPLILRQWLIQMAEGFEAPYIWESFVFTSRAAAFQAAEQWIQGR
ncbi:MAG: type secretory pathway, VirB10 component [Planctomycetota bacterium]|nr:type secretory pathway, VirB10 component [Planctomycetota bacterium]